MATVITEERPACAAGCRRRAPGGPGRELCDECLAEWLASPEAVRAAAATGTARTDVAFFDFCTRRTLERRNEGPRG